MAWFHLKAVCRIVRKAQALEPKTLGCCAHSTILCATFARLVHVARSNIKRSGMRYGATFGDRESDPSSLQPADNATTHYL
eukprot:70048-Amphidinium_carterae.1